MDHQLSELDTAELLDQPPRQRTASSATSSLPAQPIDAEPQINPFTVLIDSREQAPYSFRGLATDPIPQKVSDGTNRKITAPLIVPTNVVGLPTGDYSIQGFQDRVAIERKSLSDLYGTLGGGRERFERELHRLAEIAACPAGGHAAVIVEASWHTILYHPPEGLRMTPKSVYRSILAWQQREPFRRIHWLLLDTRELAERFCFRVLQRFWLDEQERERARRKIERVKES